MSDPTDSEAAMAKAISIYEQGMGVGEHPFFRRLRDFLSPAGNDSVLRCLLTGHHWYLSNPVQFGVGGRDFYQQREMDLPDELGPWSCFCSRCGAGTRFEDPPEECFTAHDYWCYTCSAVVKGEDIISHAREDFTWNRAWPIYGNAAVHAPDPGERGREVSG